MYYSGVYDVDKLGNCPKLPLEVSVMAAKKTISVAAAEAMYRQVKMKRDRQVQALADTELQLAGCEELLSAAREQDKQKDLVTK